jgi:PAB-dependent poly(A)-specific ribonuclease subunit 3
MRTNKLNTAPAQAQVDAGGTTYFYSHHQPPYTAYVQDPTHTARSRGKSTSQPTFFCSEGLKKELIQRQTGCQAVADETGGPSEVDSYHSLHPLEPVAQDLELRRLFGHTSTCYRATSSKDGLFYCLRRLHGEQSLVEVSWECVCVSAGVRLTTHKSVQQFDKWRKVEHSSLVSLREMFTTKAFGDNSVVFVYDYLPGAETLDSRHLQGGRHARALPESLLWDYIVQLAAAVRAVHTAGLALYTLDSTKILVTGSGSPRLFMNCAGIMDILTFDSTSTPVDPTLQQQQDLVGIGQLLVGVALQSPTATQPENFHQSLEYLTSHFSPDLHHIVQYCLRSGSEGPPHSIVEVLSMIGGRVYHCLEQAQLQRDWLEAELSKELENGRLFRLLAKLGTITERPEYDGDPQWAETGDRYLLKLFRDYLFHQVQPSGAPWVDLAHIVQSLNKLDSGVSENILLHSRDEQSVLIVSYSDLKSCIDQTFSQLTAVPFPDSNH